MENQNRIKPTSSFEFIVNSESAGMRLDAFLAQQFPAYSRSFLQKLIQDHTIIINTQRAKKPSIVLKEHDVVHIQIHAAQPETKKTVQMPQNFKIELIATHEDFLIINKPAGLLTHKTQHATNDYTLVDWLTTHFKEIESVGTLERPGIIHRLDKDTSGLLIIARTNYAHQFFTQSFKERAIKKTYLAIVEGHPERSGTIDQPIGRHKTHRLRMAIYPANSNVPTRHAVTHYRVLEYFDKYSLVEFKPETGRTHQIRVHAAFLGHPLVGDTLYGSSSPFIKRHALHASALSFNFKGKLYEFSAQLPHDFQDLIAHLKKN